MLTGDELRRMHTALGTVLKTCIRDRRALARKDAEHLLPDLEKLHQHLGDAANKRAKSHDAADAS
ncbi:16S rRNA A1518/A1519 N6-dimethyltransferase RsmA/KsgA/DIM1 with predicted DNA glycosylase/AP lyase activity [Xanthobacter flavus]|uniref:16S rRNA A1518/A1519 N6-dimethyltransferase RsmA/KsgA/DIM1 with predicted DNA glycosylase/AP lyase activity n=1 Tax=Xanthobacter flavus TaxID=281 RepID=A0A9W6CLJ8_XANFL|nr:hypothetical protein [Xanthobacter flavus]MDR6332376.1 16S rRNA A1518/A1519 N6-dimethyltransferase RsmA/KsgA/DIM1 with predicted DNA glycosylase/AP lyase activity [Xanthobacter flavus]GLI21875.1 hypothetical protein XFLAVUS301_15490 [Xanthobacter flavus]